MGAVSFTERPSAKAIPAPRPQRASDRREPDREHRQRERRRVGDHLTPEEVERRRDDKKPRGQRSARRAAEASTDQPGADGAEAEDYDQHGPDARMLVPAATAATRSRS